MPKFTTLSKYLIPLYNVQSVQPNRPIKYKGKSMSGLNVPIFGYFSSFKKLARGLIEIILILRVNNSFYTSKHFFQYMASVLQHEQVS